jgi:hypothetical protein
VEGFLPSKVLFPEVAPESLRNLASSHRRNYYPSDNKVRHQHIRGIHGMLCTIQIYYSISWNNLLGSICISDHRLKYRLAKE